PGAHGRQFPRRAAASAHARDEDQRGLRGIYPAHLPAVGNGVTRDTLKSRVNALMTRASIFFARRSLRRWMDCRVKPGNDALSKPAKLLPFALAAPQSRN